MAQSDKETEIVTFIVRWLSSHLQREIGPEDAFGPLGLDSMELVQFTDALAEHLSVDELPIHLVFDHPSARELAAHLAT
jgi:acyl carrier protein